MTHFQRRKSGAQMQHAKKHSSTSAMSMSVSQSTA
nr:MAG TPA: hypothetical protein [Caudoviricetes sp.]